MNVKFRGSMFTFLMLCVNDIFLASGNEKMSLETKSFSPLNFDMKDLGEAIYVLKINVHRDRSSKILGLSRKYIKKVLESTKCIKYSVLPAYVVKGDKFGTFSTLKMIIYLRR